MEEHVGLIVLEHLSHELDVHILDIDLLEALVHNDDGLVEFLNIGDDARQEQVLLMLVRALHLVELYYVLESGVEINCVDGCQMGNNMHIQ